MPAHITIDRYTVLLFVTGSLHTHWHVAVQPSVAYLNSVAAETVCGARATDEPQAATTPRGYWTYGTAASVGWEARMVCPQCLRHVLAPEEG